MPLFVILLLVWCAAIFGFYITEDKSPPANCCELLLQGGASCRA